MAGKAIEFAALTSGVLVKFYHEGVKRVVEGKVVGYNNSIDQIIVELQPNVSGW